MRLLHVILGLMVAGGLLLAVGATPRPAMAVGLLTVQNGTSYPCTRDGLAGAIADVDAGGTVNFDCPDPTTIYFGAADKQIVINKGVTVSGLNGSSTITLDGQKDDGVDTNFFRIDANGHLTLSNMTLQHGSRPSMPTYQNLGGAINLNESGTLDVTAVTFSENEADWGGAIHAWEGATISITASRFIGNHAILGGGAIYTSGTTTVSQSSFIANSSENAGGAIDNQGNLAVVSSTFSGNTAILAGSTLYARHNADSTSLYWSTIWQQEGSTVALRVNSPVTSIGVMLSGFGTHCTFSGDGELVDSYTLSNDTSCGLDNAIHSEEGVSDLGLAPLQTATIDGVVQSYFPLLNGSLAINSGPENCDTLIDADTNSDPDQLGQLRPNETFCDIGAFESDQPPIIAATSPGGHEGQMATFKVVATQVSSEATVLVDCTSDGTWEDAEDICFYPDNGMFNATFLVKDGYEVGIAIASVSIANLDPTIEEFKASTQTAMTGELVTFTTTADDVSADKPLTYTYDCEGGEQAGASACRFDQGGTQQVTVTVSDGDGGSATLSLTIQVYDPVTFCVSNWGGQMRVADGNCDRSEQVVALPQSNFEPLALCVNDWNGSARIDDGCSRNEHLVQVTGQDSVAVCVNRWNGSMRVSDSCGRSEVEDWL